MSRMISNANGLRLPGFLVVIIVVASLTIPACADPVTPSSRDRQIVRTVSTLLQREHLSRHKLDDEISERCLETFIKTLDSMKVYFYQSDIDAFRKHRHDLDDLVRRGDINFGYAVFQTFLNRVDERVKLVDEFLAAEHDFTIDEDLVVDRDVAQFAKTPADARERWRKRIKYDLLVLKVDDITGTEATEKLSRRYHSFAKRMHQTNGSELLEMYLTSLTSAFDPHTTYMSAETLENFEIMMKLQLEGIGAALQSEDGYTIVKKIIPGGAADKDDQLKVEDKIVGVGQGVDGEIEDVVDMKLSDVVRKIRGKRDTVVRLEVLPGDGTDRKIIVITRAKIKLTDSEAQAKVFEEDGKVDGQPIKIGVINLPSFYMDMAGARRGLPNYKSTTRDVREILNDFNNKNVHVVVLDLRHNGGGSLQEAINLTGLFINTGPVVQVKDADDRVLPYNDLDSNLVWSGPLIVLTSKFSASASEILAGAIQDYHRGLIVGDHATHGKGTVQSLMDLGHQLYRLPNSPKLGALKITMQQFYRPSGESTQQRGVLADIEFPSLTTHLDIAEADLDFSIPFDKVEPLAFSEFRHVDKTVCDRLGFLSEKRQKDSEDFQKVQKNVDRYLKLKDRKSVTLNEEKFMAERDELNAEKEEKKELEEATNPSESGIERDYYLDEVIAIAVDYLYLQLVARKN